MVSLLQGVEHTLVVRHRHAEYAIDATAQGLDASCQPQLTQNGESGRSATGDSDIQTMHEARLAAGRGVGAGDENRTRVISLGS